MQVVDVSGDISAMFVQRSSRSVRVTFYCANPTQKRQGMALQLLHSLINHCQTMVVENIFLEVRK